MVFSGQMNNITESHVVRSTDCMHIALANLLFETTMVRDGVLSLPTWFSRNLIDDVLSSVCVYAAFTVFIVLTVCLSMPSVL